MKVIHILLIALFCLANFFKSTAQTDSCGLRISLLTCSPGSELYSIFGHSAIRVEDSPAHTDIVYNYGTFDFDDPSFYSKFVRGKLQYYLSQENFPDFRSEYAHDNRSIVAQYLDLNCQEKKRLQKALQVNLREENKYYKYDFLFDNCTTRLRDIVKNNTDSLYQTKTILPEGGRSFRSLIHYYLDNGKMYWSKLGIDLLLGSRIDRPMENEEVMFLPDFLEQGFDLTFFKTRPLVSEKKTVYKAPRIDNGKDPLFTPFFTMSLLAFLFFVLGFFKTKWITIIIAGADFLLFFLSGAIGILLLFMWFGTDHVACQNNYNLLWALPTHTIAAFFLSVDKRWKRIYFSISSVICFLLLMVWMFLPQEMNIGLIPIVVLLGWRSRRRFKSKKPSVV